MNTSISLPHALMRLQSSLPLLKAEKSMATGGAGSSCLRKVSLRQRALVNPLVESWTMPCILRMSPSRTLFHFGSFSISTTVAPPVSSAMFRWCEPFLSSRRTEPTISNGVPERFSNAAAATSAQLVSSAVAKSVIRENGHMKQMISNITGFCMDVK